MKILPVEGHLTHVVTSDQDSLKGELRCACGGEEFSIYHTGRAARGILAAYLEPYLREKGKDFAVKACCSTCNRAYLLHCADWEMDDGQRQYEQFELRRSLTQRWHVSVNYLWEENQGMADGHWHCGYKEAYVDIRSENSSRGKRLFENAEE